MKSWSTFVRTTIDVHETGFVHFPEHVAHFLRPFVALIPTRAHTNQNHQKGGRFCTAQHFESPFLSFVKHRRTLFQRHVNAMGHSTFFQSRIVFAAVGILCCSDIGLFWYFWLSNVYPSSRLLQARRHSTRVHFIRINNNVHLTFLRAAVSKTYSTCYL